MIWAWGALAAFFYVVVVFAAWSNGVVVGERLSLERELSMTKGEFAMQGKELDRCRIQRRDYRERLTMPRPEVAQ